MKSIIKLMVVFVCVVSLVACGKKDTTVSANRDGVLYEAGVGVSFYYPSDFKLSEGNPNDGVTRFTKENQISVSYTHLGIVFSALMDKDCQKMLDMLKEFDVVIADFDRCV